MKFKILSLTDFMNSALWGVLAISLCAVPCVRADVEVPIGEIWESNDSVDGSLVVFGTANLYHSVDGSLEVFGTANLYPDAYAGIGIYAFHGTQEKQPGSTINVYGCAPWNSLWVIEQSSRYPGLPPVVTVYGQRFQIGSGQPFAPPEDIPISNTLNVLSESGDVIFSLWIASDTEIHLRAPGSSEPEPIEAQLCMTPRFMIRQYKIPKKVFARIRLPEGVTKDDIDSDSPIMLYVNNNEVGIEASQKYIMQWHKRKGLRVSIWAYFDKAKLMEAVPDDGKVEVKVKGRLKSGQNFYGIDTLKIRSCYRKPWKYFSCNKYLSSKKNFSTKKCQKKR